MNESIVSFTSIISGETLVDKQVEKASLLEHHDITKDLIDLIYEIATMPHVYRL